MNFGPAVKSGFRNIFNYNGRASRSEYWWFVLFSAIVVFSLIALLALGFGLSYANGSSSGTNVTALLGILSIPATIGLWLIMLSLLVRRGHDIGLATHWTLLAYVMPTMLSYYASAVGNNGLGSLATLAGLGTLVIALIPTKPELNQWGPPPGYRFVPEIPPAAGYTPPPAPLDLPPAPPSLDKPPTP